MKYRILHVIDSLTRAGTERQLVLNLSALDRVRFENYLCYLYPVHLLVEEARRAGAHPFCLELKGKRQWLSGIRRLTRFIKRMNIDIVHTNLFEADIIGGIAARLAGVPAVSTWASPADANVPFISELHLNRFKLGLARYLHRTVYKICHRHFIAVSEYVKKSWVNLAGISEASITVIPRAISRSLPQPEPPPAITEARQELSLDDAYPVILNVGRLIPQKGQISILEAMPLIIESFPGAKLIIAGEGPLRSKLENTRKDLGLDGAVSFLGNRNNIKMLHLVSDIFIFPSLSEGMPGALLEAAALGKPCIVADIDPVREILENGKSGIFVPKHDSPALAQAVIRLSSDKEEAQALGQKARETVLSRHLIDNMINKLEALYIQFLPDKGKQ